MKSFKLFVLSILLAGTLGCKKKQTDEEINTYVPISVDKFPDNWTCSIHPGTGANFNIAEFRLWVPDTTTTSDLKAILVLADHVNSNALGMVNDTEWRKFAIVNNIALIGVHLENTVLPTSNPYAEARNGSGEALIMALKAIAERHHFPKVGELPFLLRGYSAGGMYAYFFSAYVPARVVAFANFRGWSIGDTPDDNKGVPGLFLLAEKDPLSAVPPNIPQMIKKKREKGGLWGYAIEPGADHYSELIKCDELAKLFFTSALNQRVKSGSNALIELSQTSGWLGNNITKAISSYTAYPDSKTDASWLTDETVAKAWVAFQK